MADIKSPEDRSRNMSKIRSRDTKPEIWFRKCLFRCGYRYRKNVSYVPGHPDIWLAKYNTAVFIHGCFWHRHKGCKYAYMPKSRIDFWKTKFRNNTERDSAVHQELTEKGIRSVIIWECTIKKAIKSADDKARLLEDFQRFLMTDEMNLEL